MKTFRIYFHRFYGDPCLFKKFYLPIKSTNFYDAISIAKETLKGEDDIVAVLDIEEAILSELKDYKCINPK